MYTLWWLFLLSSRPSPSHHFFPKRQTRNKNLFPLVCFWYCLSLYSNYNRKNLFIFSSRIIWLLIKHTISWFLPKTSPGVIPMHLPWSSIDFLFDCTKMTFVWWQVPHDQENQHLQNSSLDNTQSPKKCSITNKKIWQNTLMQKSNFLGEK